MFMTAAERVSPPSPVRADVGRSPFVRLRELLGDMPPGKPAISLAVGEPQHPVPSFVGPVLAAHIDEFGRRLARATLRAAARHRSGDRNPGAQLLARRPVPGLDRGRALGERPTGAW